MARQANAAVVVKYGDTVVLTTAVASKEAKERMKVAIASILLEEGYIKKYELIEENSFKTIRITLKYGADKKERIRNQKIDTERESYYVFSCRKL